jgi:hypothetical protein
MEGKTALTRISRLGPVAAVGLAALGAGGCGSGDDYANRARPAAPIVVSASITPREVLVSPKRFGAGAIVLVIANQTDSSHRVTLETDEIGGSSPGLRQETAPINPRDTASLKANVPPGTYSVSVDGAGVRPARLQVGRPRPSAQDELLQP